MRLFLFLLATDISHLIPMFCNPARKRLMNVVAEPSDSAYHANAEIWRTITSKRARLMC